jgi:hypothetical protein
MDGIDIQVDVPAVQYKGRWRPRRRILGNHPPPRGGGAIPLGRSALPMNAKDKEGVTRTMLARMGRRGLTLKRVTR